MDRLLGKNWRSGKWFRFWKFLPRKLVERDINTKTWQVFYFLNIPSNPFILILCYHENLESNHAPSNIKFNNDPPIHPFLLNRSFPGSNWLCWRFDSTTNDLFMAVIDCIMTSKTSPINQHSLCSIDDLLKFKDELVLAYLGGFFTVSWFHPC